MSEPPPDRYDTPKPPPSTAFEWTPELASGHLPGEEAPVEPVHPVRRAVVWLLAAAVVVFISSISVGLRGGGPPATAFESGREAGRVVGTAVGAFLLAFLIWGIRALFAPSGRRRRLLLSPIVPVLAVLIALFSLMGASRTAAGPGVTAVPTASLAAPQTLQAALAIRSPYTAREPDSDERQALLTQLGDLSSYKSLTVRRILDGDAFVAYAILGETDLKPGADALAIAGFEMAFEAERSANPDWIETRTQVNGKTVLRIAADDGAFAMWAEPPYVKVVIAFSGPTLDSVVASFVNP
jgi:hypothetical protein